MALKSTRAKRSKAEVEQEFSVIAGQVTSVEGVDGFEAVNL